MESAETLSREFNQGREGEMLSQDFWTEIRVIAKMGKRIKVIARELGISKNTVKKALESVKNFV